MKGKIRGLALVAAALSGCDKLCSSTVTDRARIDNRAGRTLVVEVCKGKGLGAETIEVPASWTGDFTLGTRQSGYVKGGTASMGACDRPEGAPVATGIALTSRDFGAARFCHRGKDRADVVIVDRADPCPADTTEQTDPVDRCD